MLQSGVLEDRARSAIHKTAPINPLQQRRHEACRPNSATIITGNISYCSSHIMVAHEGKHAAICQGAHLAAPEPQCSHPPPPPHPRHSSTTSCCSTAALNAAQHGCSQCTHGCLQQPETGQQQMEALSTCTALQLPQLK